jgi:hypothetical protein
MALRRVKPRPGQPKKNSTTGRLLRAKRREVPMVVRMGMAALRTTWRERTRRGWRPLLWAVRTKSWSRAWLRETKETRAIWAMGLAARTRVGRTRWESQPKPPTGRRGLPKVRVQRMAASWRRRAAKKEGRETPVVEARRVRRDQEEWRRRAAKVPRAMPVREAKRREAARRPRLLARVSGRTVETGMGRRVTLPAAERPRSRWARRER